MVLGAVGFGLFAAWAKGPGTNGVSGVSQLRADIGNLSTPWLLVAFIPGTWTTRSRDGAIVGLVATMSALVGFYVLTSLLVDAGGHGIGDTLRRELWANRLYFASGALSGPLFGALGAWWRTTRSLRATVLAGGLLMGEPIVMGALGLLFPSTIVGLDGVSITVYVSELALGVILVLVARGRPMVAG